LGTGSVRGIEGKTRSGALFFYLAAADLIPELQHDRSLRALIVQTILISLGIAVMGLLTLVD
jgi:hypothetical protein